MMFLARSVSQIQLTCGVRVLAGTVGRKPTNTEVRADIVVLNCKFYLFFVNAKVDSEEKERWGREE